MEIRSYRRVFDLERRIYRIDRLRLNPGGVPVRGLVYFLLILSAVMLAGRLPLVALVAGVLPWYVRDIALPAVSAALLTLVRVEGRPFHLAAHALARFRTGPRRLAGVSARQTVGQRWHPEEIVILPDGSDSALRGLRYTGPGAVLVAVEHERAARRPGPAAPWHRARRPALVLRQLRGGRPLKRGQVIVLAPGARLVVRRDPGTVRR
jgi:hypothetical protein